MFDFEKCDKLFKTIRSAQKAIRAAEKEIEEMDGVIRCHPNYVELSAQEFLRTFEHFAEIISGQDVCLDMKFEDPDDPFYEMGYSAFVKANDPLYLKMLEEREHKNGKDTLEKA